MNAHARVTWYTAQDNTPPNSYAVAYSEFGSTKGKGYAEGAGTKSNPVALAHPEFGPTPYKKGKLYTIQGEGDRPFCGKVIDTCAACSESGGSSRQRLDVYVGRTSSGAPKWDYARITEGC